MATYYIDPAGSNSNSGTIGSPWETLAYALSGRVSGDIIHANAGTYTISSQLSVPVGVSIEGASRTTTIFNSTVTTSGQYTLYLSSSSSNTNGNQYIRNLTLKSSVDYAAFAAMAIRYRGNVEVYNCNFTNFNYYAIYLYNGASGGSYAVNNRVHDCIISNCSTYTGDSKGALQIHNQDGLLIYNNTITCSRPDNNNGNCIDGVDGYIKNMKVYNNTLTKTMLVGTTAWDFAIEIWHWEGGNEIYNNVITGSIDVVIAYKGDSDYSVWIHDNIITQPALKAKQAIRGVLLEYIASDVIIERNYMSNLAEPVFVNFYDTEYGATEMNNINIRYNIIVNVGSTLSFTTGWGIYCGEAPGGATIDNWNVYNNVIIAATTGSPTGWGISLPDGGVATNVKICNNIVQGFAGAPVRANSWGGTRTFTTVDISNNIFYGNGNSNNVLIVSGVVISGYTNENNLKTAPPFLSSTNYHLTADRIGKYITSGLTDKDGVTVDNPPTIGAYEYSGSGVVLPVVVTNPTVSPITQTTATAGGNVTSDGGATVTARGIVWSTSSSPTLSDNVVSGGTGTGTFSVNITGLVASTTYWIRAYATNSMGTVYGTNVTFTTLAVVPVVIPTVTTTTVTSITATTAVSGGNVTADGGATVTGRGVCYGTSPNPVYGTNTTVPLGTGTGVFTGNLTGLIPSTTYYIRAYAINSAGIGYGSSITFVTSTLVTIPTLGPTTGVNVITYTTAQAGGTVISNGGSALLTMGVCWSTSPTPTIANSFQGATPAVGGFTITMPGLSPGTTYYVRSYASNSAGVGYGTTTLVFTTLSLSSPTVVTTEVSNITQTTVETGLSISDAGGSTISEKGLVWSTLTSPTININQGSINLGSGSSSAAYTITGLTTNTSYFVRAYAINSTGTSYGNEIAFTTGATVPTVIINSGSNITQTSVDINSTVTTDGGLQVTARGVCWSTSNNPTISDSYTVDGSGTGSYISYVIGLLPGTTYYLRAYATNSVGTDYSSEDNITTDEATPEWVAVPTIHQVRVPKDYGALYNWYAASAVNYSYLYNWYAATYNTGGASIASTGWHVPTWNDCWTLMLAIDPDGTYTVNDAGGKMKEIGTTYWDSPNTGATNSTSFNARGSGDRYYASGIFEKLKQIWAIWQSDEYDVDNGMMASILYNENRFITSTDEASFGYDKVGGLSIRLIKNTTSLSNGETGTYIGNDGRVYNTICIGTQEWLSENLKETKYSDDTDIPIITDNNLWIADTAGAMCYYDNNINYTRDIAPAGWHVPTKAEFQTLVTTLDGEGAAGGHLKSIGTAYWNATNPADNSSGFGAKGAGLRQGAGAGAFFGIKQYTFFISSSLEFSGWNVNLQLDYFTDDAIVSYSVAPGGQSIRLIKDDSTDPGLVTDYDGNVYPTVKIGTQVWMAENLKVEHYNDGTVIPIITDGATWVADTAGAMCYYNNE